MIIPTYCPVIGECWSFLFGCFLCLLFFLVIFRSIFPFLTVESGSSPPPPQIGGALCHCWMLVFCVWFWSRYFFHQCGCFLLRKGHFFFTQLISALLSLSLQHSYFCFPPVIPCYQQREVTNPNSSICSQNQIMFSNHHTSQSTLKHY